MELPSNVSKGQPISALNTNVAFNAIRSLSMQVQALGQYQRSAPLSSSSSSDVISEIEKNKEALTNILRPIIAQPFEIYPDVKHIKCGEPCTKQFLRVSVKMKNGYILWDKYRLVPTISGRNITSGTNYPSENTQGFIREVKVGQALMTFGSEMGGDITIVENRDFPINENGGICGDVYISAVLTKADDVPSATIYISEIDINSMTVKAGNSASGGDGYPQLCIEQVETQIPLAGFHMWVETCGIQKNAINTEIVQMWRGNMYAKAVDNMDLANSYFQTDCSSETTTILKPTKRESFASGGIDGIVVVDQTWAGAVNWTIKSDSQTGEQTSEYQIIK